MAHLTYSSYEGFGQTAKANSWYNQAVRIGDRIECAGQGGWDRVTGHIPSDLATEVDQAFANVEHTLKTAGGEGWSQVYKVRAYCAPLDDAGMQLVAEGLKRYCPGHQPVLTGVGVARLAFDMHVELEVVAHVP